MDTKKLVAPDKKGNFSETVAIEPHLNLKHKKIPTI